MRRLSAIFVVLVIGCSGSTASPRRDDLLLEDDRRGSRGEASPEGESDDELVLGSPTKGTAPSREEPRGDPGESSEPPPPVCTQDAECNQKGRICEAGACVKGCRATAQCASGDLCVMGQCERPAIGACADDFDCVLGEICTANKCVPGCHGSYDCPTGQTCAAGQCKPASTGGQVQCASDGVCNPGNDGSGKICSAEGICVPGCRRDNQCPGIKICVSGMCR
ncbi:MAG: hypothetical protein KF819_09205 [Labilithrix sp.]|nr:hypothetical protein [Labilithrix sp.]